MTPLVVEEPLSALVGAALTAALGAALLLLPLGFAPLLRARMALVVGLQASVVGLAALVLAALLKRGTFSALDVGGWTGAELHTSDSLGLVLLSFDPAGAALWLAASVAGLVATLSSMRPLLAARTTAPPALVLASTITFAFACSAVTFPAVAAAFAATSLFGSGALAALRPSRDAVAGLLRLATLHRVGDALLCVAVFVCGRELGGLSGAHLVDVIPAVEPWSRIARGPFSGVAPRELWQLTGTLVVGAAATRLLVAPFFVLGRDALSPAGGVVGFVHGVTSLACGALLLMRTSAVLQLAPEPNTLLAFAAVITLVVTGALALVARDVRRVDLLVLVAFSAQAALCASALERTGALLASIVLVLACVPLCASGAHIASTCRAADPRKLGALEPRIPRTHTTRLLATGALCGPVFSGAAVLVHASAAAWVAPWVGGALSLVTIAGAALLSLAAFRAIHLCFTGKTTRSELPPLKDPPLVATMPAITIALAALGVALLAIPRGVLLWLPMETTYASPLGGLVAQQASLEAPLRAHVLPAGVAPPLTPGALAALAVAALMLGYLTSVIAFRGGPRASLLAFVERPRAARALEALAKLAGTDAGTREVGEGAIRLSRLIAVNLAPAVLETVLRRLPALVSALSSWLVRVLSSGSAQRGALFLITATALLLWWWGRA